MSAKMTTRGLYKIKPFGKKDFDVIISFHDVTNKILLPGSKFIVDGVTLPSFGNSSTSTREVVIFSLIEVLELPNLGHV